MEQKGRTGRLSSKWVMTSSRNSLDPVKQAHTPPFLYVHLNSLHVHVDLEVGPKD